MNCETEEPLMTTGEVAALFRVAPRTVTRWANDGKLSCFRTVGGIRRYSRKEVMGLIKATHTERVT